MISARLFFVLGPLGADGDAVLTAGFATVIAAIMLRLAKGKARRREATTAADEFSALRLPRVLKLQAEAWASGPCWADPSEL